MVPVAFSDTNIVIDLLAKREPFCYSAAAIFDLAERQKVQAFVSPLTLVTVYYILRSHYKIAHSDIIIKFEVCLVTSLLRT